MPTPRNKMTPDQKARANSAKERWKERNREKWLASRRSNYQKNRDVVLVREHDRWLRKKYGITLSDYGVLLGLQGGGCDICGSNVAAKGDGVRSQRFCVDHCHDTGFVRGLLCVHCNAQLGWYEKNRSRIESYIEGQIGDIGWDTDKEDVA